VRGDKAGDLWVRGEPEREGVKEKGGLRLYHAYTHIELLLYKREGVGNGKGGIGWYVY